MDLITSCCPSSLFFPFSVLHIELLDTMPQAEIFYPGKRGLWRKASSRSKGKNLPPLRYFPIIIRLVGYHKKTRVKGSPFTRVRFDTTIVTE